MVEVETEIIDTLLYDLADVPPAGYRAAPTFCSAGRFGPRLRLGLL